MNITDYTLLDWVGILSLIIGIIGLCYTISTNKAAKRIEKNVHDEKVKAVDRYRYNQEKRQYLNKAKYIREAVIRQNKLPQSTISDALSIINKMSTFSSVYTEEDLRIIESSKKAIKAIDVKLEINKGKDISFLIHEFDENMNVVIDILSKGEYEV